MITERVMRTLLAPHVSEKASVLADKANQHVFKVSLESDKSSIKRAVEALFGVKVGAVQVARVKGKSKRHGRTQGRRSDWKKAYVTLLPGSEIKLGEIE